VPLPSWEVLISSVPSLELVPLLFSEPQSIIPFPLVTYFCSFLPFALISCLQLFEQLELVSLLPLQRQRLGGFVSWIYFSFCYWFLCLLEFIFEPWLVVVAEEQVRLFSFLA